MNKTTEVCAAPLSSLISAFPTKAFKNARQKRLSDTRIEQFEKFTSKEIEKVLTFYYYLKLSFRNFLNLSDVDENFIFTLQNVPEACRLARLSIYCRKNYLPKELEKNSHEL